MNTNDTTGTDCASWCTNEDARGRTDHTCIGDNSECIELTAALDYLTLDENGVESSFCFVTPVQEADPPTRRLHDLGSRSPPRVPATPDTGRGPQDRRRTGRDRRPGRGSPMTHNDIRDQVAVQTRAYRVLGLGRTPGEATGGAAAHSTGFAPKDSRINDRCPVTDH